MEKKFSRLSCTFPKKRVRSHVHFLRFLGKKTLSVHHSVYHNTLSLSVSTLTPLQSTFFLAFLPDIQGEELDEEENSRRAAASGEVEVEVVDDEEEEEQEGEEESEGDAVEVSRGAELLAQL